MSYAFSFDCLKQALGAGSFLSGAVWYQDSSSPFTIDARLGELEIKQPGFELSIDSGMLTDADKGAFPLAGVVLALRVAEQVEPVAVVNPGLLSELQQVGLLDAVATYLIESGISYAIETIELGPGVRLTGLLAVGACGGANAAAFVLPSGLFVDHVVTPRLAAALSAHPRLLSCSASIVADKLVITARAACSPKPGDEATFSVTCSHSAQYDAANRTLAFAPNGKPMIRMPGGIPAGEDAGVADAIEIVVNAMTGSLPVAGPAGGRFNVKTAGINGAVYLQGTWS